MSRPRASRVLIYSHDSFGLGHLRRCRTIAQSLVSRFPDLSVLILSGSPLIGSFEFPTRVDFVRVPGVIKLRNGEYSSLSLHLDVAEVLELRGSIIRHTAEAFRPDIFIVDKEPLGLRGEIAETLKSLRAGGTRLVLGLRDVMDEPRRLAEEWSRKNPLPALRDLYHEIWVYGPPDFCDPLAGLSLPAVVGRKVVYTGFIRRRLTRRTESFRPPFEEPFILVTPGGGGDGATLIDRVLAAYEADSAIPYPALVVFGPFMSARARRGFAARVERLPNVIGATFDAQLERLMQASAGVVAMGGYNTFCEILSFDKPALIFPRQVPRMEQHIRATTAAQRGLVQVVGPRRNGDREADARRIAGALRELPSQPSPLSRTIPGLLDGLDNIERLVRRQLAALDAAVLPLAAPVL